MLTLFKNRTYHVRSFGFWEVSSPWPAQLANEDGFEGVPRTNFARPKQATSSKFAAPLFVSETIFAIQKNTFAGWPSKAPVQIPSY